MDICRNSGNIGEKEHDQNETAAQVLVPERIGKRPADMIDELMTAAGRTDPKAVGDIVEKIREMDQSLAESPDELVGEFRFDILLDIIKEIEE